jgi:hypothetical protein
MRSVPGFLLCFLLALPLPAPAQDAAAVASGKSRVEALLRDDARNPALWFFLARYDALAGDA